MEQVTEADAVDVVETAIRRHSSDLTTRAMCLIALLKLSSRYPSCAKYVVVTFLHNISSGLPTYRVATDCKCSRMYCLIFSSLSSFVFGFARISLRVSVFFVCLIIYIL